jgi:hypothetical protein
MTEMIALPMYLVYLECATCGIVDTVKGLVTLKLLLIFLGVSAVKVWEYLL